MGSIHSVYGQSSVVNQSNPRSDGTRFKLLKLLSPLGERLGEGVMQETTFAYPLT
jgi:hypothetical protein